MDATSHPKSNKKRDDKNVDPTSHQKSSKKYYDNHLELERERSRNRMRELRQRRKEVANASQSIDHDSSSSSQSEDEDNELVSLRKKIDYTQPHCSLTPSLLPDSVAHHVDPTTTAPIPSVPQKWLSLPQEAQVDWAARFLETHQIYHNFIKEMLAHQQKGLEMVLRFSEDIISASYEEMHEASGTQAELES